MTRFLIAATFTDSLARLTAAEQKAAKTTAFDLQVDPSRPGLSLHKLERAKDKAFQSVRVSDDIRIIVHRSAGSLLLCYVDHHDKAYAWAERRRLETHPKTGAAQLVEIRERIQEVVKPVYIDASRPIPQQLPLFQRTLDDELLGYGVPAEWLKEVKLATEETLLDVVGRLPAEAAEALLDLATGGRPAARPAADEAADPFAHPDAQRRFRVMAGIEELERALEFPWDKWTVFLHPEQRQWVERSYSGPARVAGSAGTGKTIVALHRAVFLARQNPDARVLLTTFSETLAQALGNKLRRLIGNEPRLGERIEVHSMSAVARRLFEAQHGRPNVAEPAHVRELLVEAAQGAGVAKFSAAFLCAEWSDVVDARNIGSWEAYRDVSRIGRKTRLPEAQRAELWTIFALVRERLRVGSMVTRAQMFHELADGMGRRRNIPYEFAVVDEAQDIGPAQLRFLAALGERRPEALFFAGDLGQRIFQLPFSWLSVGVDIRGRSRTLHVNYRTSHQIRTVADRLLEAEVADVDGNVEERKGTVSVFNGPSPSVVKLADESLEQQAVAEWLTARSAEGVMPHEIGVFVRSDGQIARAVAAVEHAGLLHDVLDERIHDGGSSVTIGTMPLAKGLEFRAVVVMACDDEVVPLLERIESIADEADLKDVYDTERHLLYVACTRARDFLLVTSGGEASEFLDDLAATKRLFTPVPKR